MTQEYWDKKFKEKDFYGTGPTSFAVECAQFLKNNKKRLKILDLGCGQGRDSIYFYERGFDVTAIDFSGAALTTLENKKIQVIQQDIRDLSIFEDNVFEVVCSNLVLHFFSDREMQTIIDEMYRILKPSGIFMFTVKNQHDKWYGKDKNVGEDAFLSNGITRYYRTKAAMRSFLNRFILIQFEEGTHRMFNDKLSAYWKIVARKI